MKRSIKVESTGALRRDQKRIPKIRLCGQWLAAIGFPPGSRVQLVALAEGLIELRSVRTEGGAA